MLTFSATGIGLVGTVALLLSLGCQGAKAPTESDEVDSVGGSGTVSPEGPTPPPSSSSAVFRAFPEAEGYGAEALMSCDRSRLRVLPVTNLNDAGPGSFRQAMADAESAPDGALKVIVFRVAGYIETLTGINFSGNCLYIAGQTAPGDGVTIKGRGLEFDRDPRDIVIRFLRIRLGAGSSDRGILVRQATRFVFDHLSLSWSPRTLLYFARTQIGRSGPIRNVTIQRSLLGESLSQHPTALAIGGMPKTNEDGATEGWSEVTHFSIHHNAFVSNNHRNPMALGLYIEIINNVIHNWNLDGGQTWRSSVVDWVNNYMQKGPLSRASYIPIGIGNTDVLNSPFYEPSVYAVGNVSLGGNQYSDQSTDPNADNWQELTRVVGWYRNDPTDDLLPQFRRDQRFEWLVGPATFPVTVQDPYNARESVLENVGASRGLDCAGRWILRADAADQRLIQDALNGGGWGVGTGPDSEDDVGGFPSLNPGTACTDSDEDGTPDEWELANRLDPEDSADAGLDSDGDGYLNLEEYLNGTTP